MFYFTVIASKIEQKGNNKSLTIVNVTHEIESNIK